MYKVQFNTNNPEEFTEFLNKTNGKFTISDINIKEDMPSNNWREEKDTKNEFAMVNKSYQNGIAVGEKIGAERMKAQCLERTPRFIYSQKEGRIVDNPAYISISSL